MNKLGFQKLFTKIETVLDLEAHAKFLFDL